MTSSLTRVADVAPTLAGAYADTVLQGAATAGKELVPYAGEANVLVAAAPAVTADVASAADEAAKAATAAQEAELIASLKGVEDGQFTPEKATVFFDGVRGMVSGADGELTSSLENAFTRRPWMSFWAGEDRFAKDFDHIAIKVGAEAAFGRLVAMSDMLEQYRPLLAGHQNFLGGTLLPHVDEAGRAVQQVVELNKPGTGSGAMREAVLGALERIRTVDADLGTFESLKEAERVAEAHRLGMTEVLDLPEVEKVSRAALSEAGMPRRDTSWMRSGVVAQPAPVSGEPTRYANGMLRNELFRIRNSDEAARRTLDGIPAPAGFYEFGDGQARYGVFELRQQTVTEPVGGLMGAMQGAMTGRRPTRAVTHDVPVFRELPAPVPPPPLSAAERVAEKVAMLDKTARRLGEQALQLSERHADLTAKMDEARTGIAALEGDAAVAVDSVELARLKRSYAHSAQLRESLEQEAVRMSDRVEEFRTSLAATMTEADARGLSGEALQHMHGLDETLAGIRLPEVSDEARAAARAHVASTRSEQLATRLSRLQDERAQAIRRADDERALAATLMEQARAFVQAGDSDSAKTAVHDVVTHTRAAERWDGIASTLDGQLGSLRDQPGAAAILDEAGAARAELTSLQDDTRAIDAMVESGQSNSLLYNPLEERARRAEADRSVSDLMERMMGATRREAEPAAVSGGGHARRSTTPVHSESTRRSTPAADPYEHRPYDRPGAIDFRGGEASLSMGSGIGLQLDGGGLTLNGIPLG